MSLSWSPEQKAIAKREGKALVKLQVQGKYTDNPGDIKMVGPVSREKAALLTFIALMPNDDPRLGEMLKVIGKSLT